VQNLNPLKNIMVNSTNDPGTVKITIRKFYRVNGESTQLKGVVPDIILPDVLNYSTDIGETSLENPLPYDTNAPVDYNKLNLVAPYLATLRENSSARIATNQDYIYINQDIGLFKKLQDDKTVSLNERDEIKERQTNEARQKARDKELDARKPTDVKTYEITVENADKPGLPEPMPLMISKTNNDIGLIIQNLDSNLDLEWESKFKTNGAPVNLTMNTNKISTANFVPDITTTPVPPDPMLNETASILEDYISLLSANHTLIAK
jgi:C-terminal domain of tail specific protease (DUF3340)